MPAHCRVCASSMPRRRSSNAPGGGSSPRQRGKDPNPADKPEPALSHPMIAETDPETIATYSLFRRTLSVEGVPAMPAHMEFLIDRQGYIRNRWSPAYGTRWSRMAEVINRVEAINREPPRPLASE